LYNDFIFWHGWNQKTIMRADKRYGGNQTTLTDEVESVYDMKIYHPSRQAGYTLLIFFFGGVVFAHTKTMGIIHVCDYD